MKTLARWTGAACFAALLIVSAAVSADDHHRPPLVFKVENTGAHFPAPYFPDFGQLPIVRPLPDPFAFFPAGPRDIFGRRDGSFGSWERRRNEIKAAIEKYEIGPKPDCSDCTVTASYTPPALAILRQEMALRRPIRRIPWRRRSGSARTGTAVGPQRQ